MRHVSQRDLNVHGLNVAHQSPPLSNDQATSRWSSFGYKAQVQSHLLKQQYQLCCYSEVRIDQLGLGCHIEHIENKSQAPQRTFDQTNLAASVLHSEKLSLLVMDDIFGGHAAGKQISVDMTKFVHCYLVDCARYFAYLSDGRIVPSEGLSQLEWARATYSINLLNLNSAYLVELRQQWWDELEQLDEQHIANDWDINQLLQLDLVPTQCYQLSPFFSLTRQFFGQVAETLLQ
ncbi:MAG: retron system putative HNH endonuclease, partial [Plesiomonas shigelloides]